MPLLVLSRVGDEMQPNAQYGQSECSSFAPEMRRVCLTSTAWATSNPNPVTPAAPAPMTLDRMKSRRVNFDMWPPPWVSPGSDGYVEIDPSGSQ